MALPAPAGAINPVATGDNALIHSPQSIRTTQEFDHARSFVFLPTETDPSLKNMKLRAHVETGNSGGLCTLEGEIPAARVHELQQLLPGLTRGEGMLESAFADHRPAAGPVPDRPRTDHDPLHRKEYLLRTVRRVAA